MRVLNTFILDYVYNLSGVYIPTRKKSVATNKADPQTEHCRVSTIGPALLLDKAARETGLVKILRSSFPEDWERILTCAYYLASEGNALCHVEQWSAYNQHPYQSKLAIFASLKNPLSMTR